MMVVIPVVIAVVIFLVIWLLVWMWSHRNAEGRFRDNKDLYTACAELDEDLQTVLAEENGGTLSEEALLFISEHADEAQLYVRLENEDGICLRDTDLAGIDEAETLLSAIRSIGGVGFVSDDKNAVYGSIVQGDGCEFRLYILGGQMNSSYLRLTIITYVMIAVLVLTIISTAIVTNKFVTRYIVHKIKIPLGLLTTAVTQIRSGNLNHRIEYEEQDEFNPICIEFNEMASRLQTSTQQLQQQQENRKELLASISHDLRSPLTTINAYTDGLIEGVASTEEAQQRYLARIKDKTADMIRLVNRIFAFSKLDMDGYPVELRPVRLDEEIIEMLHSIKQDGEIEGLKVEIIELTPAPVLADPEQLHNIMMNILENSRKYRTKETACVKISVQAGDGGYYLRAADDGPGVQEEELEKIFDVFYRGDPARKNPGKGSGLGLAIVANAVRRMNGTVTAANCKPHGLEISVWLPAAKETEN